MGFIPPKITPKNKLGSLMPVKPRVHGCRINGALFWVLLVNGVQVYFSDWRTCVNYLECLYLCGGVGWVPLSRRRGRPIRSPLTLMRYTQGPFGSVVREG